MNNVSKIKVLYSYEDGDVITPKMGVQIAVGHGLQQFYNAETWQVTNTNFASYPATLFPQPYSSKAGAIVVPAAGGQWYFNNPGNSEMAILDSNGTVKTTALFTRNGTTIKFSDLFEATTVSQGTTPNVKTFPALKIKANIVSNISQLSTDIHIYYVGMYGDKQFTCEQRIPVQSVVGDAYQLMVSVTGASGLGDEVLSDDNDWIQYTASLQMMSTGTDISAAVITFEHQDSNGAWQTVTNNAGITEVNSANKTLKIYEAAVNGSELYRVKATYNGDTWYQLLNPTDEHDPYYIVDGCSIDGDTVKRGEAVTWNPKVYKRHNGPGEEDEDVTTSEGWTFTYTLVSQKTGETITAFNQTGITFDRLTQYGGIATRIQASRP